MTGDVGHGLSSQGVPVVNEIANVINSMGGQAIPKEMRNEHTA